VTLVIPGYDELVEIGRGGFAVVYRAEDRRFGRTVAVKVLLGNFDDLARDRFERECRAMGIVSRPPPCGTVYDSGFTDEGKPFLVMEDMTGGSLTDQAPLPWAEALEIGVKVAGVLSASHGAGVLHRDIKPDNVLVSAYGEPKLGDFGIARFDDSSQTKSGTVSATPAYAAPELFDGAAATEASDVYSLAATLFALMTGMPPHAREGDESYLALLARAARDPVPDLRPRGVPDPVCRVIETGLEKDTSRRVGTALDYGLGLQDAQRAVGREPTRMVTAGAPTRRAGRDQTVVVPAPEAVTTGPGFWFYVDEPTPLLSPYDYSSTVTVLKPGHWFLAGEESGEWLYAAGDNGAEGWVPLAAARRDDSYG
jgi:serine/threonine-protein kinase PknK